MSEHAINDGGPAFPVDHQFVRPRATLEELRSACGMSLRDWLAGQALAGIMATDTAGSNAVEWVPKKAYAMADAMIVARQLKQPTP